MLALTEITFPCFCFLFKLIKRLSIFKFSVYIRSEKQCSIRHCFRPIFDGFPIFCKFVLQRNWKREFIIDSTIPFTILYTSVIKTCKFLWWIVISLCSLRICWKSLVSALYVRFGPYSWTLLIKLFDCLDENMPTNWQQFEWDFIIDLYKELILNRALSFWPVFLQESLCFYLTLFLEFPLLCYLLLTSHWNLKLHHHQFSEI